MIDLLLDKKFQIEEYEIKVVDSKGPPEKSHKERRWKVLFGSVCIAQNFLSKDEAKSYVETHGYLALWNALWTKGIPVSWNNRLHVYLNDFAITFKEMTHGN